MAAVLDHNIARTLTKEELAQATGAGLEVIRKLTQEVFPAHFYWRGDDDREYRYAPVCVALVELLQELHERFGVRSPIPRAIGRQVIADLERAWKTRTVREIRVAFDGMDVHIHSLKFLDRARQNLAALA